MSNAITSTSAAPITPFEDILDELEGLAREHLLFYRVQVGGVFLRHFWQNDSALFSSKDSTKTNRFSLFFERHAEDLRRFGLSRRQAIDSVRVALALRSLPPQMAKQLFLTQVKELIRLHDPTQRAEVAQAALTWDWSMPQLRDAVDTVRAGLPLDLGSTPTAPTETLSTLPDKIPAPGRLVTRAEKMAEEMRTWTAQWSTVDPTRLRHVQRLRLAKAADELEAQVIELRRLVAAAQE